MAFEIFNPLPSWPSRIEALVSTLAVWGPAEERDLAGLLSPGADLGERGGILRNCLETSETLGIVTQSNGRWQLTDAVAPDPVGRLRGVLQSTILSASAPRQDHYRFCLLLAWLVSLTGRGGQAQFVAAGPSDLAERFEAAVPGAEQDRRVNEEKVRAGLRWAEWLGIGKFYSLSGQRGMRLVAYPCVLLSDFIAREIPPGGAMAAREFASRLANAFPFVDGGTVAAALPASTRTDSDFGPAVSEALRLLRDDGFVELVEAEDTPTSLRLHYDPTRASDKAGITEIRRRVAS
jgi:hypothetical protein